MDTKVKGSLAGATWASLVVGILLLVLLIIFILQNPDPVAVQYFGWKFTLPTGITVLLAAIVGAAVMALIGIIRMFQLRRQVKRRAKAANKAVKKLEKEAAEQTHRPEEAATESAPEATEQAPADTSAPELPQAEEETK
ncbi:MAG: lipopolysaccharide assembly protein LapA domain-containing protein [Corynebacterium sp.]|nr:lipopolysaccharide assembly protein LapA domain-containing protein [Corynebacterium sp.]